MEPESAFARYVAGPEEEWNLAEAALLIAAEAYPALDVGRTLQWLEAQGRILRQRLAPLFSPAQVIAAVNRLLFDELGFHGNTESYYDPRNSLLNDVIERRTGIPITLALVVMDIGARAGLTVEGVGLPGHFIVRVRGEGWQVLLDPFNRGAELSRYDCEQLMAQALGRPMPLLPHYLEPVAKRAFLMRMLNNLQAVYLQDRQWARVMATIANLFSLRPEPSAAAELYRVRGLVHYELGRLGAAEQDWLHYLTLAPDAPDERLIRDNIAAIRSEPARRN